MGQGLTDSECGMSWLLDIRLLALAVLILVALVAVATRLMR